MPARAAATTPMLAAIKNFQKRHKAKITGVLTPSERADLVAAAKAARGRIRLERGGRSGDRHPHRPADQAGAAMRATPRTARAGRRRMARCRSRPSASRTPDLTLAALFEREKKEPATRQVETSVLHDDNFIISGMQGLKMFSVRAKLRDGEMRGFTMLYDQMMEGIVAPVMVAMASAFSPFPERSAPFAALAKTVEYGTGLVVSAQGHIVTDAEAHRKAAR